MTAMQHADDHFLPNVAPLGQRERAILDARLERDGVGCHIDAVYRIARFDARGFERRGRRMKRARRRKRSSHLVFLLRIRVDHEAWNGKLIDAPDDDGHAGKLDARILILHPRAVTSTFFAGLSGFVR